LLVLYSCLFSDFTAPKKRNPYNSLLSLKIKHQDFVRQDALLLLENALEGSGGGGSGAFYLEAFRIIMRGVSDKSFIVRVAAARCLKAFANIGGPGLGMAELDTSMTYCVKVSFTFLNMSNALQLGGN
jgi:hypothetical protein